ncbi:putative transporter [Cyphellophora attinorum]|uniref:Putative transporter n=1 Tax=Cyphellophora attinorum TaxID=1664694 RepID=A0A0N1GYH8_9EURO|nr:putative transporter [Phialophora attinorum]KPI35822.1 putative transporter [Phialophora attinorum]
MDEPTASSSEPRRKLLPSPANAPHAPPIDKTVSRHPTHIERLHTHRLQHIHTVGSQVDSRYSVSSKAGPLPKFGGGKPYPPDIPAEREAYVVDFESPTDPVHPLNWPTGTKLIISAIGALACLCSTFASSVLSVATPAIASHFGIGLEPASLVSALYLVGYGVGPAIWAPLSELRGRKLPLLIGLFGFSIFSIAVAVSKDTQTIMISRFFMGVFGSCPLAVVAAMYADIWRAEVRGLALTVFAAAVFMGPMIAPFIGAFTVTSYLGWRWDGYWSAIMGFTTFLLILVLVKETYPPIVLVNKAEYLRRRTRNWAIHAKQEEIEIDLKDLISKNLSRPLRMLVEEPILLLMGFYLSFVYGLVYISLAAFPFVFVGKHHIKPGVAELPYLGMLIGMFGVAGTSIAMNGRWVKKFHANGGRGMPEWRLPLACVSAVIFVVGLFWFGWAGNYESVHWIVPTIAGVFIGYGLLGIFMQLNMYIIESYLMFAASAIAGNTMIRSLFAAACPLFDRQMFEAMHVNWAMSLLGFVALALAPVPFLFYRYGPRIRGKSKWAPQLPVPKRPVDEEDGEKKTEDEGVVIGAGDSTATGDAEKKEVGV